jgi:histidinol-phosphate aminotransferase
LDANESFIDSPFTEEQLRETLLGVSFNRYPDPYAVKLCAAFASYYGLDAKNVTAGNGSDELIGIICSSLLMKGDRLLTLTPDFSMYRFYTELYELESRTLPKNDDFLFSADYLVKYIRENFIRCVILSNPCNPTSVGVSGKELLKLAKLSNALVVIDEAYMDFWSESESLLPYVNDYPNLIVLRTASKACGSAALRLGFAVCGDKLTRLFRAVKAPYNVNAVSQALGEALYADRSRLKEAAADIKQSLADLKAAFTEKNYAFVTQVYDTKTNFLYIKTNQADEVSDHLKQSGIVVRRFDGFLRITCGRADENAALLHSLDAYK